MENGNMSATNREKDIDLELGMTYSMQPPKFQTKKVEHARPSKSWWMTFSSDAQEGIGVTGLKYVLTSKESRYRRLGWICILVISMIALIWQIIMRSIYFSTFPLSVDISLDQTSNEVIFPKVIICNINQYQKSKIRLQPAIDKVLTNYENSHYNPNKSIPLTPEEMAYVQAANMSDLIRDVGQSKEDMIIRIIFAGKPVDFNDIVTVQTEDGMCYQINDGFNSRKLLKSNGEGKSFGMNLIMDTQLEEYYINRYMMDAAGFYITLLEQNETFYNQNGFYVGPGTYANVAITPNKQHNARPPYGICGEKELDFFDKYSQKKCLAECMAKAVVAQCGCRPDSMPGNAPVCDPIRTAICTTPFIEPGEANTALHTGEGCECPLDCDQKTFSISLSTAKYPNPFRSKLFAEYIDEGAVYYPSNKMVNQTYIEQNFVAIDMYFTDTSTTVITQQAAYPASAFLCDIGGAMGLWLGGSLLTLYEILDLCGHSFFSNKRK